jgi:chromosome segregation ATPase
LTLSPDDLDSLFSAPPTGFIEERKRIVAALKSAGRKEEAKTVEKIPRPSLAVWTVNQIARRDPEVVRRLGAITERLKTSGGAAYGAAAAELRQVVDELRGEAAAVLAAAGHEDVGPHLVQRVIANLRAAAGNAETRATLEQGRLARDVEEQDVVSLFGGAAGADTAAARGPATVKAAKADDTRSKAAAADAKAQQRARAKAIVTAEREVKRLRADAAAARKQLERTERAVATARDALAAAEKSLATERADADATAEALAQAEGELARLSEA